MKRTRILKKIFLWMIGFGFLILLGTAGASDMEMISLSTLSSQNLLASGLLIVGALGNGYINRARIKKRRPRATKAMLPVEIHGRTRRSCPASVSEISKGNETKRTSPYATA